MKPHYINTDLDLASAHDLRELVKRLEERQFVSLHCGQAAGDMWTATLELLTDHEQPQAAIHAMLDVLDTLTARDIELWKGCSLRVFDVGLECGGESGKVLHELSNATLLRLAASGASLRLTLYNHPDSS